MPDSIPFKIYNARNASSQEAFVYLGKASKKGFNGYDRDYFAHQYENGCQAVFLLATITSTRTIKVHKPTEANPYVVLQTKDYEGLDNKLKSTESAVDKTSVYRRTIVNDDTVDRTIDLRTFKTDESIQVVEYDNEYDLKTWKYDFSPACIQNNLYYKRKGIPSKSNVLFYPKAIIAGECIAIDDSDPTTIIFSLSSLNCCPIGPCLIPVPPATPYCSWSPKVF